jgi:hypothetical protein
LGTQGRCGLDEIADLETVAVGKLAEAVHVESPQERPFRIGQVLAAID